MSKKLKNFILFVVFIAILFVSTFSSQFSNEILWSNERNDGGGFSGLLFKNPVEISDLVVSRAIENKDKNTLIRYDVEFNFSGDNSSLRILGVPVRQVFFNDGIVPKHSSVTLKGDYDKINEQLFNNKLKHRELYKNIKDYNYKAISEIRVPLDKNIEKYSFSIYYEPTDLVYNKKNIVAENSVFITNARVQKFINVSKDVEGESLNFSQSGFYINAQEILNKAQISKISVINNIDSVVFVISIICVLILIWLDKKKWNKLYISFLLLILLTFHRFLGLGVSTLAVLIFYPVLAYIAACISRLMGKEELKLTKKELKQNLAYTIIFFIVTLIIIIIPRAF